jgi:outer membrane protein OmpA-like peptidoglycan-associated protein
MYSHHALAKPTLYIAMLIASMLVGAAGDFAQGADRSLVDSIESDLQSHGRQRRGSISETSARSRDVIKKAFEERKRRGPTLLEEDELYEVSEALPQRDLEVFFEFNSAEISPRALKVLDALGDALSRDSLKNCRILINGHTDKVGSWSYNKDLSQRRADAVARYLAEKFKLDPANVLATGYSYDKLKNTSNPLDPENRRVQVVNAGRP